LWLYFQGSYLKSDVAVAKILPSAVSSRNGQSIGYQDNHDYFAIIDIIQFLSISNNGNWQLLDDNRKKILSFS